MIAQVAIANTKRTIIRPQSLTKSIWIDASDYAVGAIPDGTVLTNKGNAAIVFEVEGNNMAVQLNANNKKEFVFDGTTFFRCTSGVSDFTKYKDGTQAYTIAVIGKVGTTANPDAAYGICGNSAFSSLNHGIYLVTDNRVATASNLRGYQFAITKAVGGSFPILSRYNTALYNTKRSLYFAFNNLGNSGIDLHRLYADSNIEGVTDRVRTTANSTSGLGTPVGYAANAPTHAFDIGTTGNGNSILVGTMEQFIIYDKALDLTEVYGLDEYFQVHPTGIGNTSFQNVSTIQSLSSQYILGGAYDKNAGKSRTLFVTSRGTDHFVSGTDREGVQVVSTNNIVTFPTSYTTVFSDGSNATHNPAGGYTPTGRYVVIYGRYSATTGTYNALVSRYSDDNGTTWSAESSLTIPTTVPALTAYISHDKLVVCNNGDIAIPVYAFSGTSLYKLYVCRSTDNGVTWSFTEIYSSTTVFLNELSFGHMGGNDWLVMARVEAASGGFFEFRQFYSDDDLATFTDQSNTDFNLNYVFAHPPTIRPVMIDGTRVMELGWVNRGSRRWHFKYALPAALITNGATEWNSKTLYTMVTRHQGGTGSNAWRTGYPLWIHPNTDLKAEGVWFEELNNNETTVHFVRITDFHKQKIKTDLGI